MEKMSLRDVEVADKTVLVRVDFNVPLKGGEVADETRIRASLPTIRDLVERGARTILCSHLGRPKGKPDPEKSLRPAAGRLSDLIGREVRFASDCVGEEAEEAARSLANGDLLLLENLRFHAEEEANDDGFSRRLASLADLYVNDAFGSAHRAHASTEGVTKHLSPCVAGFLMEKELEYLGSALADPRRPFVAILGGAKISGKIDVMESLLEKVDALLVGGAMMFTFLRAEGERTGRSLVEEDRVETARRVAARARERGVDLRMPVDCRVSASTDGTDPGRIVSVTAIPDEAIGVDIGPGTLESYRRLIESAGTVVWNGPMGIFEVTAFSEGTFGVAGALADATMGAKTVTIVGGGDSAAAVVQAGLADKVSHVSTGGGASLEFLEGKVLPGVAALTDAGGGR
ncbi:MAG: phosphoglycerate kinase [Candidatus Eisenbacteria bacterium]|nr:phosphoglycerate kinase [Candidatus Latescibacterota bacterium]MBD3301403.1 phosphoglycerate kinase [Candidatus Eisenbacteria bacterium]